jgi:hypothetical protein
VEYSFPEGSCAADPADAFAATMGTPCGTVTYPGGSLQPAPLHFLAEVTCLDAFAGDQPAGHCFQFMEYHNFPDGNRPVIWDEFLYTMVHMSEQRDGSIYWHTMTGAFGVTRSYLTRDSHNGDTLPVRLGSMPGALLGRGGNVPRRLNGVWNGNVTALNAPYNREISLHIDRCSLDDMWWNEMCATVQHKIEGATLEGTAGYNTMVVCQAHFQGANPVDSGGCYEFNEFLKGTEEGDGFTEIKLVGPDPPVDNMYNWGYWIVSEQKDGSLFWSYLQGNVVVANAHLNL